MRPEFIKLSWVVNENKDIYLPDYTDVLRVAFTSIFKRGKISDLVSLLSGRDFETREYREDIAADSFKKLHDSVMEVINQTNFQRYLMILRSVGIIDDSLIRSQNVLNFGYILYLLLRNRRIDSTITEKIVRRWVILTILTGRYSGSPESMFDYDVKRFYSYEDPMAYVNEIEAGDLSDAFWNNVLVMRLETSVTSSPLFKVFLMAQIKEGDKGFLSEQIDVKSMIEQRGDIHHLFPKQYLRNNGVNDKTQYNQVANYVYLQSEINIKIKDAAPKEYMGTVYEQCATKIPVYGGIVNEEKLEENLRQNCIPDGFKDMDVNDYQCFLDARRKLMAAKIHKFYESLK